MKIYGYESYEEYREGQIWKNERKFNLVWITDKEIKTIVKWLRKNFKDQEMKFGICHGVRNGYEVKKFRELLPGVNVIGTDISPTINQVEHCIELDFHEVKDEWLESVDFICSDSFDHSNRPEFCLDQWMSCLKSGGVCIFQWSAVSKGEPDRADCLRASFEEIEALITKKYKICHTFSNRGGKEKWFFIVKD